MIRTCPIILLADGYKKRKENKHLFILYLFFFPMRELILDNYNIPNIILLKSKFATCQIKIIIKFTSSDNYFGVFIFYFFNQYRTDF